MFKNNGITQQYLMFRYPVFIHLQYQKEFKSKEEYIELDNYQSISIFIQFIQD
jgi:hypothetical protein